MGGTAANRGEFDMQLDPITNVVKDARILIVDDRESNIGALSQILGRAGYAICISLTDPAGALAKFAGIQPDLLLLDWHMEPVSGLEFIEALKSRVRSEDMPPVLVLSADTTAETRREALAVGATDFLSKPLDASEVLLRIRNLLQMRLLHCRLQDSRRELETQVRERANELEQTLAKLRALQQQVPIPACGEQPVSEASFAEPPHPLSVLVVDDEPEICHVLTSYLECDAHTVVTAENGCDALEKFRAGEFDLVITDRAMPKMTGDQLAAAIREISPGEPIILLTAFADREHPVRDIDLLLSKPASLSMIRQAIGKVLKS